MKCPSCHSPYTSKRGAFVYFCPGCKMLFDIRREPIEMEEKVEVEWNPSKR